MTGARKCDELELDSRLDVSSVRHDVEAEAEAEARPLVH